MTPQSNIMVVAPIIASREPELRQLLASMNREPGVADPANAIVPFDKFTTLHFARFVILEDDTREDLRVYGVAPPSATNFLAFLCDFDGPADALRRELVARAEPGLRQIFSFCESFTPSTDLLRWMEDNERPPSANYVNWVGRTTLQVSEENDLFLALSWYLNHRASRNSTPRQLWNDLRIFVNQEQAAGRLTLTPPEPTPLSWQIKNLAHCIGIPLVLFLLLPLIVLYLPFFLIQLRMKELRDPVIAPRQTTALVHSLDELEDRIITNQFSAYGSLKPGPFRRWTIIFVLLAIEYTARHIFTHGFLGRVKTIQFARWVFIDKTRVYFSSNYDGSLEMYNGDFINKVSWGLNIVFSNGLGYPTTSWLILDGAKDEQPFKDYLRRHQLPTQVWYNAAPGVTAYDMQRNSLIRNGLQQATITDSELDEWIKLF
jgi:hypothetical protein